nr:endocuticle structural glycoprotein SgAbd-5-like [Procambarus clarkii]
MASRLALAVVAVAVVVTGADQRPTYGQSGHSVSAADIVKDDRTQDGYGEYSFQYASSDGTAREEYGTQHDGQTSKGGWRYTSPEGVPVDITFVADHGGYQPQGAVLPVAPALPYKRYGN